MKEEGDRSHLTYKKILINGFSLFCDWELSDAHDSNNESHARACKDIDVELLEQEQAAGDGESENQYFKQVLKEEFEDEPTEMNSKHKMIVDNFNVEANLQLNKDIKSPIMPATLSFPQI